MKKLLLLTLALLLSLAACSAQSQAIAVGTVAPAAASPSAVQSAAPTITDSVPTPEGDPLPSNTDEDVSDIDPFDTPPPTPASTDTPDSTPTPPVFIAHTDIPDDIGQPDDTLAVSSDFFENCIREDKYNIYYTWNKIESDDNKLALFCVNKKTGIVQIVSRDVCSYALCGGKVYYTGSSGKIIKSYDPVSRKTKLIKKFKHGVFDMASYKGKLYFTYETVCYNGDEPFTDLYSMKPDGSGKKKIRDNVAYFSIYKDIIYYNESDGHDGAPIDRCKISGSGWKNILDWAGCFTAVCDNKIYYSDDTSELSIDISSGKTTLLPSFIYDTADNGSFAPLGKYILCLNKFEEIIPNITAYDTVSKKNYNLMELAKGNYYDLYTNRYGAYIVWTDSTNKINIDRIVISGGKASLEKITQFSASS
jgi:hypothetical protein